MGTLNMVDGTFRAEPPARAARTPAARSAATPAVPSATVAPAVQR
jgi:hypothetical protein